MSEIDTNSILDALKSDDKVAASNAFTDIMQSKINAALDDKKIEIAQSMSGVEVEEEPVGDIEADEDISGVSDDELVDQ